LIRLARHHQAGEWGPDWEFWRGFARRLFTALCGLGEASPGQWKQIAPPAEEELAELAAAAPPMRGLEYLDAAVLRNLWSELAAEIGDRAATWKGGPAAFLADVDPLFHQLGRVTFHLAENKRDPARPFAFLATYTHRVSERAKVAHLPLAEAVKTFHARTP
jgi:non-specific serine/threonine protein kinase